MQKTVACTLLPLNICWIFATEQVFIPFEGAVEIAEDGDHHYLTRAAAGAGAAVLFLPSAVAALAAGVVVGTVSSIADFFDPVRPAGLDAIPMGSVETSGEAVKALPASASFDDIRAGKLYEDYMAYPRTDKSSGGSSLVPVYVGGFRHFKYHGKGKMYLPGSAVSVFGGSIPIPKDFPVLEGTFKDGRLVSGTISAPACIRGGSVGRVEPHPAGKGKWLLQWSEV
jgi:hypothetical protein